MNRLRIISLASLAALDFAAALFVWRSFAGADGDGHIAARSAAMIVPAALSEAPAIASADDPETLSRPLFVKSRRPSQNLPPAAREASAAPPPAGLKLHAVVGFSQRSRAFVTSDAAAEGRWLSVGETFENWTVDSIAAHEIALRQDADRLRVGVDYDAAPAPAGLIPAPAPVKPENREDAPPPKAVAPEAGAKDAKRGGH